MQTGLDIISVAKGGLTKIIAAEDDPGFDKLQAASTDGGYFYRHLQKATLQLTGDVYIRHKEIKREIEEFTEHSTDMWAPDFPDQQARGRPKDEAFLWDMSGVLRKAAAKFVQLPDLSDLRHFTFGQEEKANWYDRATGITALTLFDRAAIMIRSDAGFVHATTVELFRDGIILVLEGEPKWLAKSTELNQVVMAVPTPDHVSDFAKKLNRARSGSAIPGDRSSDFLAARWPLDWLVKDNLVKLEHWGFEPEMNQSTKAAFLNLYRQIGDSRVVREITPALIGSSKENPCELRIDGVSLAAAILHRGSHVYLRPFVPNLRLCLRDIGSSIPLRNGMLLRLADPVVGPTFRIDIDDGGCEVTLSCGYRDGYRSKTFTDGFDVGRSRVNACCIQQCPESKCVPSMGFFSVKRQRGSSGSQWVLVFANEDTTRMKGVWLELRVGFAYLVPAGALDGRSAFTVGPEVFQLECGGQLRHHQSEDAREVNKTNAASQQDTGHALDQLGQALGRASAVPQQGRRDSKFTIPHRAYRSRSQQSRSSSN